jgi:hypothetical protein
VSPELLAQLMERIKREGWFYTGSKSRAYLRLLTEAH